MGPSLAKWLRSAPKGGADTPAVELLTQLR